MIDPIHSIRGVVFDFDGTIIVSEHVHMLAWEDLARSVGLALPDGYLEHSVGLSDLELIKILAAAWSFQLSEYDILSRKRRFYMSRAPKECVEVPGVVLAIQKIYASGFPIAIATSSSREEVFPIIERLKIKPCFKSILTVEDVKHPKPAPEIYLKAAENLGTTPHQCLAFEDSKAGACSARGAGCHLVTLETIYSAQDLGPAMTSGKNFEDPKLLELIDRLIFFRN